MLRYIDFYSGLSIRMSTPVISTHCLSFHLPLANGLSKKPFMEVNEVLEVHRGCFGSGTGPKRALESSAPPTHTQQPLPPMGKLQGKPPVLIDCFYNLRCTTTTAHGCICFLHVLVHSWLHITCFRRKRHIWFDFKHLQPSKFLT